MENLNICQSFLKKVPSKLGAFCQNTLTQCVYGYAGKWIYKFDNNNISEKSENSLHSQYGEMEIISFDFMPQYDSLCLSFNCRDSFSIYLLTLNGYETSSECAFELETPAISGRWSHDYEHFCFISQDQVYILNSEFSQVHQSDLNVKEIGSYEHVSLGWGSKSTQFKGKGMKAQSNEENKESSKTPPQDNLETENKNQKPCIAWNIQENRFLAISNSFETQEVKIRIYDRFADWTLHTTLAYDAMALMPICWRPDYSDLLTAITGSIIGEKENLKPSNAPELSVNFYESNGLRLPGPCFSLNRNVNYSFPNSKAKQNFAFFIPVKLEWNTICHNNNNCSTSDEIPILAILYQDPSVIPLENNDLSSLLGLEIEDGVTSKEQNPLSYIELWTAKNYIWYLKQVIMPTPPYTSESNEQKTDNYYIVDFQWDVIDPYKLFYITQFNFRTIHLAPTINVSRTFCGENKKAVVEVCNISPKTNLVKALRNTLVINGSSLQITPLNYISLPVPALYAYSYTFPLPISTIAYIDTENNVILNHNFKTVPYINNYLYVFLIDSSCYLFECTSFVDSQLSLNTEELEIENYPKLSISMHAEASMFKQQIPFYKFLSLQNYDNEIKMYELLHITPIMPFAFLNSFEIAKNKAGQNHSFVALKNDYCTNQVDLCFINLQFDAQTPPIKLIKTVELNFAVLGLRWVTDHINFTIILQSLDGQLFIWSYPCKDLINETSPITQIKPYARFQRPCLKFSILCCFDNFCNHNENCLILLIGLNEQTKSLHCASYKTDKEGQNKIITKVTSKTNNIDKIFNVHSANFGITDMKAVNSYSLLRCYGNDTDFLLFFVGLSSASMLCELHSMHFYLRVDKDNSPTLNLLNYEIRKSLELNSTIISASMEPEPMLWLHIPRGSMEIIYPRILLSLSLKERLNDSNCCLNLPDAGIYQAFLIARRHRIPFCVIPLALMFNANLNQETIVDESSLIEKVVSAICQSIASYRFNETDFSNLNDNTRHLQNQSCIRDSELSLFLANCDILPENAILDSYLGNNANTDDHKIIDLPKKEQFLHQFLVATKRLMNDENTSHQNNALYLSYLTVCAKLGDYKSALTCVKRQSTTPLMEKGIKHLLYFARGDSSSNSLYTHSLATHDLDLALLVAKFSHKDPKEYLPELETLKVCSVTDTLEHLNNIDADTDERIKNLLLKDIFYRNYVIDVTKCQTLFPTGLCNLLLSCMFWISVIFTNSEIKDIESIGGQLTKTLISIFQIRFCQLLSHFSTEYTLSLNDDQMIAPKSKSLQNFNKLFDLLHFHNPTLQQTWKSLGGHECADCIKKLAVDYCHLNVESEFFIANLCQTFLSKHFYTVALKTLTRSDIGTKNIEKSLSTNVFVPKNSQDTKKCTTYALLLYFLQKSCFNNSEMAQNVTKLFCFQGPHTKKLDSLVKEKLEPLSNYFSNQTLIQSLQKWVNVHQPKAVNSDMINANLYKLQTSLNNNDDLTNINNIHGLSNSQKICLNFLPNAILAQLIELYQSEKWHYQPYFWSDVFWLLFYSLNLKPTPSKSELQSYLSSIIDMLCRRIGLLFASQNNRNLSDKETMLPQDLNNSKFPMIITELENVRNTITSTHVRLRQVLMSKLAIVNAEEQPFDEQSQFVDLSSVTNLSSISTLSSNSSIKATKNKMLFNNTAAVVDFDPNKLSHITANYLAECGGAIKPPPAEILSAYSIKSTTVSLKSRKTGKSTRSTFSSSLTNQTEQIPLFIKRAKLKEGSTYEHVALFEVLLKQLDTFPIIQLATALEYQQLIGDMKDPLTIPIMCPKLNGMYNKCHNIYFQELYEIQCLLNFLCNISPLPLPKLTDLNDKKLLTLSQNFLGTIDKFWELNTYVCHLNDTFIWPLITGFHMNLIESQHPFKHSDMAERYEKYVATLFSFPTVQELKQHIDSNYREIQSENENLLNFESFDDCRIQCIYMYIYLKQKSHK